METAFEVPASGTIPYQYFEVPTNLTEDKWVEALEVRAGDRSVVHHVLVYVRHPDMTAPTVAFRPANPPGGPTPPQDQDPSQLTGSSRPPSGARRGPLMTQIAPGTPPTVYVPGTGLCSKLVRADVPDSLHDQRQGSIGSQHGRFQVFEGTSHD